jgi:hypothetical protein
MDCIVQVIKLAPVQENLHILELVIKAFQMAVVELATPKPSK